MGENQEQTGLTENAVISAKLQFREKSINPWIWWYTEYPMCRKPSHSAKLHMDVSTTRCYHAPAVVIHQCNETVLNHALPVTMP
jgi:hypothetical protein